MKLQVTMINQYPCIDALHCMGETMPFDRRQITIELTPEQAALLEPRVVSEISNTCRREVFGPVWIEP